MNGQQQDPCESLETEVLNVGPMRIFALLGGAILGVLFIWLLNTGQIASGHFVEDPNYLHYPVSYQGRRLNEWLPNKYPQHYPPEEAARNEKEGLWVGNSQINAIYGEPIETTLACKVTSEALGFPFYSLSMGGVNFQELLVVIHWALLRREIDWVVLSVSYMSLRRDGLRDEMTEFATSEVMERLRGGEVGLRLVEELEAMNAEDSDIQGTIQTDQSLSMNAESSLNAMLDKHMPAWSRRNELIGILGHQALVLRNKIFGIDLTTPRRYSRLRLRKNMEALEECITTTLSGDVDIVLYITPVRWDMRLPFNMNDYLGWKDQLAELAAALHVRLIDLDHIVPDEYWSNPQDERLDVTHFKEPGHVILGERIAELIRSLEQERQAN